MEYGNMATIAKKEYLKQAGGVFESHIIEIYYYNKNYVMVRFSEKIGGDRNQPRNYRKVFLKLEEAKKAFNRMSNRYASYKEVVYD